MAQPFLTAEWRKLAMANYIVDPALLSPWVPLKTDVDFWNNRCYISLVGFMFMNTRIKGFKIPFHINFEEINLRFYVRNGDRRGVVFIKEIVPSPALSFVANTVYKENYETLQTQHSWIASPSTMNVEYRWKKGEWNTLRVSTEKTPVPIQAGSEEEFITEHYWGYTKISEGESLEYQVEHPRWQVYPVKSFTIDVDFGKVYGEPFAFLSKLKPASVFLAEGSEISVLDTRKL